MEFANKLKAILKKVNISQAELAEKTGIRASSISDWITGKYVPKQDKKLLIAKALRVNPEYFTTREEKLEFLRGHTDFLFAPLNENMDDESLESLYLSIKLQTLSDEQKAMLPLEQRMGIPESSIIRENGEIRIQSTPNLTPQLNLLLNEVLHLPKEKIDEVIRFVRFLKSELK